MPVLSFLSPAMMQFLSRVRLALPIALSLAAVTLCSDEPARADSEQIPMSWHRDKKDPHWVQGTVTVDAPPDEVWARMQQVDTWPQMLSDIKRMKVTEHRDTHWKLDLETRTLSHGMLGYDVQVSPSGRTLKLYTDRMGVRVVAQTDVAPGPTAQQSVVTYSFLIALSGIPSMLMSDADIRAKQEHMEAVTLADFYKAFHK